MSPNRAIGTIGSDELVEVTPKNIRMRKKILDTNLRRRNEKHSAEIARVCLFFAFTASFSSLFILQITLEDFFTSHANED